MIWNFHVERTIDNSDIKSLLEIRIIVLELVTERTVFFIKCINTHNSILCLLSGYGAHSFPLDLMKGCVLFHKIISNNGYVYFYFIPVKVPI
ncbi:hypothetical protein FKM82_012495 [Ascaphus truei]